MQHVLQFFPLFFLIFLRERKYSKLVFRKASKVGANTCFSWQVQLLRQHTSAYVSMRQHTTASAYVSIRRLLYLASGSIR